MEDPLVTGEEESDGQASKDTQHNDNTDNNMTTTEDSTVKNIPLDEHALKNGDSPMDSREESEPDHLENGMADILGSVANKENNESGETKLEELKRVTQEQSEMENVNVNIEKSENVEQLPVDSGKDKSEISDVSLQESNPEPSTPKAEQDASSHSPRDTSPHSEEKSNSSPEGGSHRSPDRQSKVEYRKIKSEVTGEAETSESEDENDVATDKKESEVNEQVTTQGSEEQEDPWMDMLGNGLLKKRVLREGKGRDSRPDKGQIVTVQTAGRTDAGTPVDWNGNLEFILGDGEVIQALDLAVALMELDEVCELVTDSRYAYGKVGKPQGSPPVPADAKLTYEIQLLAVRDGPNITNMSDEERLKIGEKKREMGNDLYITGDYSGAINSYQRAIKYLAPSSSEEVQVLRVKCWNNMAAAQLRIKAYSAAEKSCSQVLQVDPANVKALFRKGKVLAQQGETAEALVFIKKADQLDPSNKTIRAELNRLKQLEASERQNERNMYRRMVGDLTNKDSKKTNRTYLGWPLVFGATVVALGGILITLYLSRH